MHLRVARPSDNIKAVTQFYRDGLGFEVLSEFTGHDGFNGVMLGCKGAAKSVDPDIFLIDPVLVPIDVHDLGPGAFALEVFEGLVLGGGGINLALRRVSAGPGAKKGLLHLNHRAFVPLGDQGTEYPVNVPVHVLNPVPLALLLQWLQWHELNYLPGLIGFG